MITRPRLHRHVRVLRRGAGEVQVGPVLDGAVLLAGLDPRETAYLEALSRGSARRPPREAGERIPDILSELAHRGLLYDASGRRAPHSPTIAVDAGVRALAYGADHDGSAVVRARRQRSVVIAGTGNLADAIAGVLRDGGVGRVGVGEPAATAALAGRGSGPALVVLLAEGALVPSAGQPWSARGIPHLPVVVDGPHASIGPLVTPDTPCLRCLDLTRADRDPAWPALLSQVGGADVEDPLASCDQTLTVESTLCALVAGLTAAACQAHLDGQDAPAGLSSEVSLPWARVVHRQWARHPRCHCAAEQG